MQLRAEFYRQDQELSPPAYIYDERLSSKDSPQPSHTVTSKHIRGRAEASRRPLRSINKVEKTQPSTNHSRGRTHRERLRPKKNCRERSPEQPQRPRPKKSPLIELEPFAKWIHSLALDLSLKILQFILYFGQSRPQEHVCRYKFDIGLVTNNEAILCKVFPNTLSDTTLT